MRGRPTTHFLAKSLLKTAEFLKYQCRPTAVIRLKQAARRLELLDCELRNERAKQEFTECCKKELAMKA